MKNGLKAVLFDVDGTLVDSNDAHARAWVRAFAEHGIIVDPAHVRRCIGMGGDKLMPEVSDLEEESPQGSAIAKRRGEIFMQQFLPALTPFNGAANLVAAVKARGLTAVAASSAKEDELKALLSLAGAEALMDAATSSDDAEESKPDPDIIQAALQRAKAAPSAAVMIGDTPYDIEAASRCAIATVAVRSGGFGDDALSGAMAIYDDVGALLANFDASPLNR